MQVLYSSGERKNSKSLSRGRSRTTATFKMDFLVIIVNGFKPSAIITKCSILDVAAVLYPPLLSRNIFDKRWLL